MNCIYYDSICICGKRMILAGTPLFVSAVFWRNLCKPLLLDVVVPVVRQDRVLMILELFSAVMKVGKPSSFYFHVLLKYI